MARGQKRMVAPEPSPLASSCRCSLYFIPRPPPPSPAPSSSTPSVLSLPPVHHGVPTPPAALPAVHSPGPRRPATHELRCQPALVLPGTPDVVTAGHASSVSPQRPTSSPDTHAAQLLPTTTWRARPAVVAPQSSERHAARRGRHPPASRDADDAPRTYTNDALRAGFPAANGPWPVTVSSTLRPKEQAVGEHERRRAAQGRAGRATAESESDASDSRRRSGGGSPRSPKAEEDRRQPPEGDRARRGRRAADACVVCANPSRPIRDTRARRRPIPRD